MNPSPGKTTLLTLCLALAGGLLSLSSAVSAGPLTVGQSEGAETLGCGRVREVIVWPNDIEDSGSICTETGGAGQSEATLNAIVGDGPDGQTGSGFDSNFAAFAKIVGGISLPELGVFAKTSSPTDTAFSSTAEARVLQSFTFTGDVSTSYTLSYTLDGLLCCDYLDFLSGYIGIGNEDYDPEDPFGELTGSVTLIDSADLFAVGQTGVTNTLVNETATLNITLDPGDVIWLDVKMSAVAQDDFRGDARSSLIDGMHTLAGAFTAGDTTLLTPGLMGTQPPGVAAVPAPSAGVLLCVGVLGLAASRRRRSGHTPA